MKNIGFAFFSLLTICIENVIGTCNSGTFSSDPENCNNYYQCIDGELVKKSCPIDFYWDNDLNICVKLNINIEDKSKICAQELHECQHGDYLPNLLNCGTFYQCVHGKAVLIACPTGLFWNNKIQVCDWPYNSDCKDIQITTETSTDGIISTTEQITTNENNELELNCYNSDYLPNRFNCSTFYQCVHGNAVLMPCPTGLFWNNQIQVCDWPQNSDCKEIQTTTDDIISTTEEINMTENVTEIQSIPTAEITTDTTDITSQSSAYTDPLQTETTVGNDQTSASITDDISTPTSITSNSNEQTTKTENYPIENTTSQSEEENVSTSENNTSDGGTPEENSSKTTESATGTEYNTISTDPEDNTNQSPSSTDPVPTEITLSTEQTSPSEEENVSTVENNTTEWGSTETETQTEENNNELELNCNNSDYLPNPSNCSTFYQCVHGKPVLMPCPTGLFWNNQIKVCDWPANTDCHEIPTTETTTNDEINTTEEGSLQGSTTQSEISQTEENNNEVELNCKNSDYLPNPFNCSTFYQCVHGNAVLMPCPEGLFWNNQIQVCDWSYNSDCKQIQTTESVTDDLISTIDTIATTENEIEIEFNTTTETSTDPAETTSNSTDPFQSETTVSNDQTSSTIMEEVSTHPNSEMTTSIEQTTENYTLENTTSQPEDENVSTPENNTSEGATTEKNSASTTEIDPEENTNHSTISTDPVQTETTVSDKQTSSTGIEEISTQPNSEITISSESISVTKNSTLEKTTPQQGEENVTTPENNTSEGETTEEGNLPDSTTESVSTQTDDYNNLELNCYNSDYLLNPTNCSTFYQCVHGKPVLMPCPTGLFWNNQLQVCDWPFNSNCEEVQTTAASSTNNEINTTVDDNSLGSTNQPEISQTEENNNDLELNCNNYDYLPNPSNCSTFYQCVHGKAVLMPCPTGLLWNNKIQVCDWPANSNCQELQMTSTTVTNEAKEPNEIIETNTNEGEISVESSASTTIGSGISQTKNDLESGSNSTSNQNESSTKQLIINSEEVTESQTIEDLSNELSLENICDNEQFIPNPYNCNSFFQCVHGKPFLQNCPSGLHWNSKENICDWPSNANCKQLQNETSNENTSEEELGLSNESTDLSCDKEDYLPNPYNCNTFYQCVHGEPILLQCPTALHWNKNINVCDWPVNAKCIIVQPAI